MLLNNTYFSLTTKSACSHVILCANNTTARQSHQKVSFKPNYNSPTRHKLGDCCVIASPLQLYKTKIS